MTDHPKKPNKIVIPAGAAPEWAYVRARRLWKEFPNRPQIDLFSHLIAMLEEEPIDEDLIEARKICAEDRVDLASDYLDGGYDSSEAIRIALAALKRGRELGKA